MSYYDVDAILTDGEVRIILQSQSSRAKEKLSTPKRTVRIGSLLSTESPLSLRARCAVPRPSRQLQWPQTRLTPRAPPLARRNVRPRLRGRRLQAAADLDPAALPVRPSPGRAEGRPASRGAARPERVLLRRGGADAGPV